ncbi:MAG: hypothetical protein DMG04_30285 [Acidobacteria bacterium]|nr:MAG: hypothetical protein DMG04_30285 [Acidobacteriota bacterium]PYQ82899.1 MAG: hypothetical protein DMG03_16055 [Acidobacteriota bacterium]PYQ92102.1 MAG: hypothetical protein DMG02_01480 [Acidobacteriota bacterium]PYR08033.1 MAG: hypothetical protein DMF99_20550 [Acidobacteriota bacterium]
MKTATILVLAGALLGVAVASLVVPPAMAWYTSPGGLPQGAQVQAIVQIPEVIRYATSHLIRGQMIGGAIGAALGLILGIFVNVDSRRPHRVAAAESAAPAPPPRRKVGA